MCKHTHWLISKLCHGATVAIDSDIARKYLTRKFEIKWIAKTEEKNPSENGTSKESKENNRFVDGVLVTNSEIVIYQILSIECCVYLYL